MKCLKFNSRLAWLVCCITFGLVCANLVSTGCAGKGRLNATTGVYDAAADADPIVVAAEDARKTALDIFDAFLAYERANQQTLLTIAPGIHLAAEAIRRDGKEWINELTRVKLAYQANRVPANKALLTATLANLKTHLTLAQGYSTVLVDKPK